MGDIMDIRDVYTEAKGLRAERKAAGLVLQVLVGFFALDGNETQS